MKSTTFSCVLTSIVSNQRRCPPLTLTAVTFQVC